MSAIATVHTSGINVESVLVIVGSVTGTLGIVFGAIARSLGRYVAGKITASIDQLRIDVISALEVRVTALEASTAPKRRR
jgi:hypothetical protein